MNENKNYESEFKFKIFQGDTLIIEKIFPTLASNFHPLTRNFVDIREFLPSISNRLYSVLSLKNNQLYFNDYNINIKEKYLETFKLFNKNVELNSDLNIPSDKTFTLNDISFTGVPCKFGLYINDNPIVERDFYVRDYNPSVRYSFNLYYLISDIVDEIHNALIKIDKQNTWDDYTLINKMNLSMLQIRDMSKGRRSHLLSSI